MSKFESDELETVGYFLPEDSQLRLKKLHEYVVFLSRLAQPRSSDEAQEWVPEIRAGEVGTCLELLAEQIGCLLDELSWPANRGRREAAPETGAEPEAAEEMPDDAGGRYPFGVTLEQVDALNRLIGMICAHGDVVIASDDAEFAKHTLSLVGDAIFDDARTVRDIIRQVESQRPGPARDPQTGVGEERAAYHAGPAYLSLAGTDAQEIKQSRHNSGHHFVVRADRHVKTLLRFAPESTMRHLECSRQPNASLIDQGGVPARKREKTLASIPRYSCGSS